MIWSGRELLGWRVEVDDRLVLDECSAEVRILDSAGAVVRFWRVWIARRELGLPVFWSQDGGRPACFGGPSHAFLLMAQTRAADLLADVVRRAEGEMPGLILAARERADGAGAR